MDADTRDAIVAEMIAGASLRAIASHRDLSVEVVRAALDEAAVALQKGETARREILIESGRLDALLEVFFKQAKSGDVASGALYGKLSERKASLRGLNAPIASAVTLAVHDAPRETSTQNLRRVFFDVKGITGRERELEEREYGGQPLSDAEAEELDAFREAREAERRRKHDEQRAARRSNGG